VTLRTGVTWSGASFGSYNVTGFIFGFTDAVIANQVLDFWECSRFYTAGNGLLESRDVSLLGVAR